MKRVIFFLLSVMSFGIIAGTIGEAKSLFPTMVTISLGPAFENAGQTQTFNLQPDLENTYQSIKNTHTLANGGVWLGKQFPFFGYENVFHRYGLAITATSHATLTGNIWDDADPDFNNYTYSGKVEQTSVVFEGKWLYQLTSSVLPYLSIGIGLGINRSYDFIIKPQIIEQIAPPTFANNTQAAFTYTIGLGLEKQWDQHFATAIGYEFADWGKSNFAAAPGQTIGTGPVLNNLYTNEVLFSFIYTI